MGKKPTHPNTTDVFFTFKVTCRFSNLWVAHYSKYQQFLYDTICKYREKGWNYVEIANWLNDNNFKTPLEIVGSLHKIEGFRLARRLIEKRLRFIEITRFVSVIVYALLYVSRLQQQVEVTADSELRANLKFSC